VSGVSGGFEVSSMSSGNGSSEFERGYKRS
jgi:hypothetical protein